VQVLRERKAAERRRAARGARDTRLSGCEATRRLTQPADVSRGAASLDSTTSSACADSWASSSRG